MKVSKVGQIRLSNAAGSSEEIPARERLSGTGTIASPDEPVVDSTGAGRVTCRTSRAAQIN